MIVDLQVNLEPREGSLPEAANLVKAAKAAGLDGVLLTQEGALTPDIAPYREAGEAEGVKIFQGLKIATNHGLLLCILPDSVELAEDFAARENGVYQAEAVIDAVEERAGVTIALRPYDRAVERPMGDHIFSFQGLSACDVQNASVSRHGNDLALEAASSMEIPCVGTSSAMGTEGLGTSATLLRYAVTSQAELCEAIRNGDCWPLTFGSQVPPSDERPQRGPGRGHGGPSRGGGGGGGGGRRDHRGGRPRRGGGGGGGGGGGEDDRRRGGGGGGGGGGGMGGGRRGGGRRRGPPQDGGGNRGGGPGRGGPRGPLDDDAGNRVDPRDHSMPDEDIGNRLAPGEASPYRTRRSSDDDMGNG